GCISSRLIEAAGFNGRYPSVGWKSRYIAGYVGPVLAGIACHLKISVIGADPNDVAVLGGLGDRIDGGVSFRVRIVHRQAARFLLLLLGRIVGGQIGRDSLPGVAVVSGSKEKLRSKVNSPFPGRADVN